MQLCNAMHVFHMLALYWFPSEHGRVTASDGKDSRCAAVAHHAETWAAGTRVLLGFSKHEQTVLGTRILQEPV